MAKYIRREDALWIASLTNASKETKERLQNWKAADVQPVKRGHWIETDYGMFYECSECGNVQEFERNFCYECGADMRGDKNG